MAASETTQPTTSKKASSEVEFVKCECCGLTEECTEAYIKWVRERFQGRWICGLCAEAVKEEEGRVGGGEALNQHMGFCKKFRSLRLPPNPTEELIPAMKQLFLRSLDSPRSSPRSLASPRSSPMKKDAVMVRSKSCFSTMNR